MMKTFINLTRALAVVTALALVPAAAKAQGLGTPPAAEHTGNSFDAYHAMAVTAGIMGGALVATIVTDGLILPVLANGGVNGLSGAAGSLISTTGSIFGAVAGAMYGDDWYHQQ